MDDSDWTGKLAAAQAQAEALGKASPDIRVSTNADEATAKLTGVAVQADALGSKKANVDVGVKGATEAIAEIDSVMGAATMLNDDMSQNDRKRALAAIQAIEAIGRAEAALGQAQNKTRDATDKLAAARRTYGTATEKLAKLEENLRRAEEAEGLAGLRLLSVTESRGQSLKQLNDKMDALGTTTKNAGKQGAGGLGAILAAIAPILPATVPLAAGVAGLGLGFIGMGAAAMLVFKGIQSEIKKATPQGLQFKSTIDSLKSSYEQLQTVSAQAALPGLTAGLKAVNQQMPTFKLELYQAGSYLGGTLNSGLSGLSQLLVDLSPVLNQVGAYVEGLARKFDAWTHSPSARHFIGYLMDTLPQVEALLGDLGTTVVHLLEAFAPFGTIGLSSIGMLFRLLSDVPTDKLQTLTTLAMGAYTAFETWKGLGWIFDKAALGLDKVGLSAQSAALKSTGASLALGAVGAVLGIAAIAWSSYEQQQQQARQHVDDLTTSLDKQTGAITGNTAALVAKALQDSGASQAAKDLGVSLTDLTTAAINPSSQAAKDLNAHLDLMQKGLTGASDGMTGMAPDAQTANDEINALKGAIGGQNKALHDAVGKWKDSKDATDAANKAMKQAGLEAQQAAPKISQAALAQMDQATAAATDQKAIQALNSELDAEINKQLMLQGGLTAEGAARLQMVATLKKETASTSLNTDAGIKQRQAIEQAVGPIQSYRDSQIKAGVSTAQATKTYEDQATSLLQTIAQTDGANSATYKYAQQLLKVPGVVNTQIGTPGADVSIQKIKDLHAWGVKTNGNKVEIVSKIPLATDVLDKIKRIKGASVNANGTKVTVDSSMPNYAQVMAEIAAIEQQAVDRSFTITGYVRQLGHLDTNVTSPSQRRANKYGLATGGRVGTESAPARLAAGGFPVRGPGSGLSDSIPAMLSNGEYVLNAATVAGAGGFDAIDRLVSIMNGQHTPAAPTSTASPVTGPPLTPAAIAAAVRSAMHGAAVTIDGKAAGRLLFTHIQDAAIGSTTWVGA